MHDHEPRAKLRVVSVPIFATLLGDQWLLTGGSRDHKFNQDPSNAAVSLGTELKRVSMNTRSSLFKLYSWKAVAKTTGVVLNDTRCSFVLNTKMQVLMSCSCLLVTQVLCTPYLVQVLHRVSISIKPKSKMLLTKQHWVKTQGRSPLRRFVCHLLPHRTGHFSIIFSHCSPLPVANV